MSLFSKRIETKKDHHAEMKSAILDAINAALKAGVPPGSIERVLAGHAADFRRQEEARIEARSRNPMPTMYDPVTFKPIDAHGEAARREEARIARELREQQAAYRKSVNERYEREKFLRG